MVESVDSGLSPSAAARRDGLSSKTAGGLWKRRRESGTLAAKPGSGAAPCLSPEQHAVLAAQMREYGRQSLQEHAGRWQRCVDRERCVDSVPQNRGQNTPLLGALGWSGVQAVMTREGAARAPFGWTLAFEAFGF
jgi:hypothetical protein